jgi:hypothetical protein
MMFRIMYPENMHHELVEIVAGHKLHLLAKINLDVKPDYLGHMKESIKYDIVR